MSKLLAAILADGQGYTSSMRLIVLVLVLFVVFTKIYNAWITKSTIAVTGDDLAILGMAFGGKIIQNTQEKTDPTKTP